MTLKGSLFKDIPAELPEEIFEVICLTDNVRIERIVSCGQVSPEGFWFDQERNEFVLLVRGSAALKFEKDDEIIVLQAGDYLNIRAHVKHRVEWTAPATETVWLAVYY